MDANYASKNLTAAVLALASGMGTIQGRLLQAYDTMMPILDQDIPPQFLSRWISIRERFEKHQEPPMAFEDPNRVGHVRYTLDRTSDAEGSELALDIYRLDTDLETFLIQNR